MGGEFALVAEGGVVEEFEYGCGEGWGAVCDGDGVVSPTLEALHADGSGNAGFAEGEGFEQFNFDSAADEQRDDADGGVFDFWREGGENSAKSDAGAYWSGDVRADAAGDVERGVWIGGADEGPDLCEEPEDAGEVWLDVGADEEAAAL